MRCFQRLFAVCLKTATFCKFQSTSYDDESDFVPLQDVTEIVRSSSPILGIRREQEVTQEDERSRLNLPLATPRKGVPLFREGSRATELLNYRPKEEEVNTNELNSSLPFDDDEFAEKLLEIESEGAIDECWQETQRAHFEDVEEIVGVLREMKVRDVAAIDVSSKTSSFDYIVNGTCEGPRHIHLAAWAVQEADKFVRVTKVKRKMFDHTWEVVPVGRIVINLMTSEFRETVAFERKWAVTKNMDPLRHADAMISEGRMVKAHGLWTLTLNLQDLEDFEIDYCKDFLMEQF